MWIGVVAVAYFGAAQIGLRLALAGVQVTALWPPTGIAVACLVLLGPRVWPGITLGAFATNLALGPTLPAVLVIAAGNTAAPVCAYLLLARSGFRGRFEGPRDVLALVFLGALAGMSVSATIGSVTLAAAHDSWQSFWPTWLVWWTGDAMGVLTFTPLILLVRTVRIPGALEPIRVAEAAALTAGTVLAVTLPEFTTAHLHFAVFPFLIWAAVRFHLAGAMPCAVIASIVETYAASRDLPAFAGLGLATRMINLQVFNATVALTALLHATVIQQRDQARHEVDEACTQLAQALAVLGERNMLRDGVSDIVERVLTQRRTSVDQRR
ncbi:hypothetical protein D7D52_14640 [Nocardia yunnanensis]|uniref:MASE1 domain-containing protein n=1 Tax=Nocardia yunnanensis TaxID=2382165 RepID=A0A386ZN64_9NOCA|nr:hypothetical protein D7D52_14640 [Nocardia yunnanensis]